MPDISEELDTITSNRYGESVRTAIINALDKVNQGLETYETEINSTLDELAQRIEAL